MGSIQIVYLFTSAIGYTFVINGNRLILDESSLEPNLLMAIKTFALESLTRANNVEAIVWTNSVTIFTSKERCYTLAIFAERQDPIDPWLNILIRCAEQIKEYISEQCEYTIEEEFFFSKTENVEHYLIPIIVKVFRQYHFMEG